MEHKALVKRSGVGNNSKDTSRPCRLLCADGIDGCDARALRGSEPSKPLGYIEIQSSIGLFSERAPTASFWISAKRGFATSFVSPLFAAFSPLAQVFATAGWTR